MKILDEILLQLQDSQWHNLDEFKKYINFPSDKLNMIMDFLEKQSFIDMNHGKLKITNLGLKLLYL